MSHQSIEGNLYCTVEIFDKETGQWVAKQDVGTMNYSEKEKSQASDSFKRACFNWGIGRELYTAPFIWIPAGKAEIKSKENRYYCNDRFSVSSIGYNEDREISALMIVNEKGQKVYELRAEGTAGESKASGKTVKKESRRKEQRTSITKDQMDVLQLELDRTGVTMEAVKKRYQIQQPEAMNEEVYSKVMNALKHTKSVEAA